MRIGIMLSGSTISQQSITPTAQKRRRTIEIPDDAQIRIEVGAITTGVKFTLCGLDYKNEVGSYAISNMHLKDGHREGTLTIKPVNNNAESDVVIEFVIARLEEAGSGIPENEGKLEGFVRRIGAESLGDCTIELVGANGEKLQMVLSEFLAENAKI